MSIGQLGVKIIRKQGILPSYFQHKPSIHASKSAPGWINRYKLPGIMLEGPVSLKDHRGYMARKPRAIFPLFKLPQTS